MKNAYIIILYLWHKSFSTQKIYSSGTGVVTKYFRTCHVIKGFTTKFTYSSHQEMPQENAESPLIKLNKAKIQNAHKCW